MAIPIAAAATAGFASKIFDAGKSAVKKVFGNEGVIKNIGNAAGKIMHKIPGHNYISNKAAELANVAEQIYGHDNNIVKNIKNFSDTTKTGHAIWNPVIDNGYPNTTAMQTGTLVPYTGNLYGTNFRKVNRMKFRKKKRNTLGFKHRVSKF